MEAPTVKTGSRPADGRRVMIGWMQNWDTCNPSTVQRSWFGQMSLPRELSIKKRTTVSKIHQRRSLVRHQNGKLRLRLILDRFSAELFVNDGEQVLSETIYNRSGGRRNLVLFQRPG